MNVDWRAREIPEDERWGHAEWEGFLVEWRSWELRGQKGSFRAYAHPIELEIRPSSWAGIRVFLEHEQHKLDLGLTQRDIDRIISSESIPDSVMEGIEDNYQHEYERLASRAIAFELEHTEA